MTTSRPRLRRLIPPLGVGLLLVSFGSAFAGNRESETSIRYGRDIRPILSDRFFLCHGPDRATREAGLRLDSFLEATRDLDGVAATGGPGLIGGVVVGTVAAKAIATARGSPYYAVNHLSLIHS